MSSGISSGVGVGLARLGGRRASRSSPSRTLVLGSVAGFARLIAAAPVSIKSLMPVAREGAAGPGRARHRGGRRHWRRRPRPSKVLFLTGKSCIERSSTRRRNDARRQNDHRPGTAVVPVLDRCSDRGLYRHRWRCLSVARCRPSPRRCVRQQRAVAWRYSDRGPVGAQVVSVSAAGRRSSRSPTSSSAMHHACPRLRRRAPAI